MSFHGGSSRDQPRKSKGDLSIDGRCQVAARIRPLNTFDRGTDSIIRSDGNSITVSTSEGREKTFVYDNVFTGGQQEVYDSIGRPMLNDAFEGYNVCLFAYGQTGSGKTYSILGDDIGSEGMIPRICNEMFQIVQQRQEQDDTLTIKITMSYLEIYNEKVRDLLYKREKGQAELPSLEIREYPDKKVVVEGLYKIPVVTIDRIRKLIDYGNSQKQVSETKMNEKSSRSHSILQFTLHQVHDPPAADKKDVECTLTIVDLAGSERQAKSEAEGKQFEEMRNINKSLLMLGRALNSFSDGKNQHVPLRESKLTRLLSESFGGNSRTWMIACVSPSQFNYTETMSTLEYAQNAKKITNHAKVNSLAKRLELKELREANSKLQELYELEKEKNRRLEADLNALRDEYSQLRQRPPAQVIVEKEIYSPPPTVEGRTTASTNMYVGRAKVSLRNIIEQTSFYGSLPLLTYNPEHDGAVLVVNIYPVDAKGASKLDNPTKSGAKDLIGHRVDFVVHIIKATGLPKKFCDKVYCKYVYKWAEKDSYRTPEVQKWTDPVFDFKKRFAFTKMNQGLVEYFMSDNVITFEVIGVNESTMMP